MLVELALDFIDVPLSIVATVDISLGFGELFAEVIVIEGGRLVLDELIMDVHRRIFAARKSAASADRGELFRSEGCLVRCFHTGSIQQEEAIYDNDSFFTCSAILA